MGIDRIYKIYSARAGAVWHQSNWTLSRDDENKDVREAGIEKDMSTGMDVSDVVKSLEFILSLPDNSVIPELGIKHING